jgi:multiple sugar transport system ATP-binding protein
MSQVELRGIGKRFGRAFAIQAVDLQIEQGEFCCFVGPSGCGKSTLLRLIAGLEDVDDGEIRLDGQRVDQLPPAQRGVAMVFQSYALYPHMTVYQNMAFGLQQTKLTKDTIERRIGDAARMLQIESLLERRPKQLSGGQRQRVAIGRAIVRQPRVFLFDEPLSNLDAGLRQQTRVELARLHARLGATMIYVTHDQTEAMTLADKIVVLRDGRVEQIGDPMTLYHHPANRFVAGFLGSPSMNFLQGRLDTATDDRATLTLLGGRRLAVAVTATKLVNGATVSCGFRPEHVSLIDREQADLHAEVLLCERLGDHSLVMLELGNGETLTAKVAPGEEPAPGETVGVQLAAEHGHLFDDSGFACPRTVNS